MHPCGSPHGPRNVLLTSKANSKSDIGYKYQKLPSLFRSPERYSSKQQ
ncbi:Uncharacterised protein [Yersinia similis]|uniref:Uncharacterized protein n=1 Tax=Yersinia similis TaxID=367190 RepID=A0A0T9RDP1_9GAMM|nr:Uncharacterised protein [Yersinia similis]CNC28304.1 Uncharacterised protein [Yersinia similis]CNF55208.1 Uncharacterised protein [Yersinia similis]CNG40720.1 Uncharacterised protein [Yersinia similis]CNI55349.1 Uncharacterised protein [Yersinia similis]